MELLRERAEKDTLVAQLRAEVRASTRATHASPANGQDVRLLVRESSEPSRRSLTPTERFLFV